MRLSEAWPLSVKQRRKFRRTFAAGGMSEDEIIQDFPDLTREDTRACLAFAADRERHLVTVPAA